MYTDAFFSDIHVVVNALDNLEARRYMDRQVLHESLTTQWFSFFLN